MTTSLDMLGMAEMLKTLDKPFAAEIRCSPDMWEAIKAGSVTAAPSYYFPMYGAQVIVRREWQPRSIVVLDQHGRVMGASRPVPITGPPLQDVLIELVMRPQQLRPKPARRSPAKRARVRRMHAAYRRRRR